MKNFEQQVLEGGCYVLTPQPGAAGDEHTARMTTVIGPKTGATKMTQVHAWIPPQDQPALRSGEHDVVLYVLDGGGHVDIGGKKFQANARSGIYVRPGETFTVLPGESGLELLLTWCHGEGELLLAGEALGDLDRGYPHRVAHADGRERQATGDRYYKLLVGPELGSMEVTQFIGMIPESRAAEHFHTYEEAICILSGHGRMWAGDSWAPVRPGSIIFLPIRQPHCLECEDPAGMELVGLFHPAGSPAINYKTGEAAS